MTGDDLWILRQAARRAGAAFDALAVDVISAHLSIALGGRIDWAGNVGIAESFARRIHNATTAHLAIVLCQAVWGACLARKAST